MYLAFSVLECYVRNWDRAKSGPDRGPRGPERVSTVLKHRSAGALHAEVYKGRLPKQG